MNEIKEAIGKTLNPITGKPLAEEGRVISVEEVKGNIEVKYNRDGIDPVQKKKLENDILDSIKSLTSIDNVFLLAQSSGGGEVHKSLGIQDEEKPASNPAQLKVGHGTVGEKRGIPGVKHIMAIGSGKGGVGKSTFTSNMAVALANKGHKVGVVDADIYGPSMPLIFNKRNKRPESTTDKKIIPFENHGVKFISFGSFIHEDEPVVWRGPMLGGVLNQFFFETDWGELDYLLIDLPPGTGDVQLSMVQNLEVDGAIIISTPQDMALLDARKALHMFDKMDLHVIGMVENMSSFLCDGCGKEHYLYGTGGVNTACSELGIGFLGKLPMDLGLRKGADFGKPYMANDELFKGSKVWKAHEEIAARIDSYFNPTDTKKKGLLSKLLNRS
jgi:ATP-binding protein involved in chromosome partitioning